MKTKQNKRRKHHIHRGFAPSDWEQEYQCSQRLTYQNASARTVFGILLLLLLIGILIAAVR